MALPIGDMAWPPPELKHEIARVKGYADWYGGDLDDLQPNSLAARRAHGKGRGVAAGIASLFVGTAGAQPGTGETNPLHVPVPADLARTSADLLFSETPALTFGEEAAQARWEELVDELDLDTALLEAGELAAALSGMYWRASFDVVASPDAPLLSLIQPDNAWPEWSWGRLVAVTFVRRLGSPHDGDESGVSGAKVTYRHLERHGMTPAGALVEHGLYAGTDERLGRRLPLTDHPQTADIAASLTAEEGIVLPGIPMTAGYIPNMRPNRGDRGSRLGRSDYDQLDGLFRSIDETWTSWMRDLRLGKARIVVPSEYLSDLGAGQGSMFSVDREVYEPLRMQPPAGSDPAGAIKSMQFAIRVAEHQGTLRALVQQAVSSAGYSMRTFGMGGTDVGGMTATQVDSEDRLSMITREKKARYWTAGLRDMAAALLGLDAMLNRTPNVAPKAKISVEFRDAVAEPMTVVAATANLLAQAQAASTQTLVTLVHPEWSELEVAEEVSRIQGASGLPLPDPAGAGLGLGLGV
jgi:A118 family predicted phage portal protein